MLESIDHLLGAVQTGWARLSGAAPQFAPPSYLLRDFFESAEPPDKAPVLKVWEGPLKQIPRDRSEVYEVYGDPGDTKPSRAFQRRCLTVARNLPGEWNHGKGRLYVHWLVESYLREALRRAELNGSLHEIRRMGAYNFRHQRHDPKRPLSYHSWAIAIDINPDDNRARTFAPGKVPGYWSDDWRRLWPRGVSESLVSAFESVGWRWGGRWKTFKDNMHFELVA